MEKEDKIYKMASNISTQIVRTVYYCGEGIMWIEPEEFYAIFNRIMNYTFRKNNEISEEEVLEQLRPRFYNFPCEFVSKKLADKIADEDYKATREIMKRVIYLQHLMKEGIIQKQGDKMKEIATKLENMIC